jgi:hypothetical protein
VLPIEVPNIPIRSDDPANDLEVEDQLRGVRDEAEFDEDVVDETVIGEKRDPGRLG